jgi:hypothetical protein
MPQSKTALSDRPISNATDDSLKNNRYAIALADFIQGSDTPITIGIQGGWGTGKTSLLNLLKFKFEESSKCLVVLVNAWEHSLFNSTNSADVAASLLKGLVDELLMAINSLPNVSDQVKRELLGETSDLEKLTNKIGRAALGVAAYTGRVALASMHIELPNEEKNAEENNTSALIAKQIRELREKIAELSKSVQEKLGYDRIVFFIDDLDRVQPQTAVEILDVLKNIFDVENAIFVIAIDYEVVVRGLTSRFGDRNESNEREFRQYFDKIIQVPFSMPITAYEASFTKYMSKLFDSLGMNNVNDLDEMVDVAWRTSQGVPRSVKRIVNTMSLLALIGKDSADTDSKNDIERRCILFMLVCIQIGFPSIYAKIAEHSQIKEWSIESLAKPWGLPVDKFDMDQIREDGFSYQWQQVLFLLTAEDPWLKSRTEDIATIIQAFLSALDRVDDDKRDNILGSLLNSVSVTTVGAPTEAIESGSNKNDETTAFCRKLHQKFIEANLADENADPSDNWARRVEGRTYIFPIKADGVTLGKINLMRGRMTLSVLADERGKRKFREHMKTITKREAISEFDVNSLWFWKVCSEKIDTADETRFDEYVGIFKALFTRVNNKVKEFNG